MPLSHPFPPPAFPDAKPVTTKSPQEDEKYEAVLKHFSDPEFRVTGEKEEEKGVLTEYEQYWLSRECILRYLRATKWDVNHTITRLESTLSWRRTYGFYRPDFTEHVEPEATTGKTLLLGFDTGGRPCIYLIPSKQNTTESPRQLEYLYFMFECTIEFMPPGVENVALLINFGARGKAPSIATSRGMLHILQNHYPERLGKALVINVPWILNAFFTVILPFVDPITRAKIHFNPKVTEENLISADQLIREWDGDIDFVYEHSDYWPELLRITNERREANMQRWRQLGARVGISEWDYKDGNGEFRAEEGEKAKVETTAPGEGERVEEALPEVEVEA